LSPAFTQIVALQFGDILADFIRSRLAQDGFDVSEPRLRSRMLLRKDEGEMMLGRESRALVPPPGYSCIVAGTYAAADSRVYVAVKLISVNDARIMAAVDFVVWRTSDIDKLLQS
jgi:hypothetical protein